MAAALWYRAGQVQQRVLSPAAAGKPDKLQASLLLAAPAASDTRLAAVARPAAGHGMYCFGPTATLSAPVRLLPHAFPDTSFQLLAALTTHQGNGPTAERGEGQGAHVRSAFWHAS